MGGGVYIGDLLNPQAYGSIPSIPSTSTDTSHVLGTDVEANLIKNLPQYRNLVGADSSNIAKNLAGQLSPDVLAQITQGAAERGIQTGSPGSANANAAFLRALGLNSMQLQELGHTQLTEAMNRTPVQQSQDTSTTKDNGVEAALAAAQPNPGAAARANLAAAQLGTRAGGASIGGGSSTPGGLPMSGPGYTLPGIPAPTTLNSTGSGYDYQDGYVPGSNFNWQNYIAGLPGQNNIPTEEYGQPYQNPYGANPFGLGPELSAGGGAYDPLDSIYNDLGITPSTYDPYADESYDQPSFDQSQPDYWADSGDYWE